MPCLIKGSVALQRNHYALCLARSLLSHVPILLSVPDLLKMVCQGVSNKNSFTAVVPQGLGLHLCSGPRSPNLSVPQPLKSLPFLPCTCYLGCREHSVALMCPLSALHHALRCLKVYSVVRQQLLSQLLNSSFLASKYPI